MNHSPSPKLEKLGFPEASSPSPPWRLSHHVRESLEPHQPLQGLSRAVIRLPQRANPEEYRGNQSFCAKENSLLASGDHVSAESIKTLELLAREEFSYTPETGSVRTITVRVFRCW